jgi:OOP family OmpA-OmpF porin
MQVPTRETPTPPGTPDSRLAEALGPAVESALIRCVRREPRLWAESLYPIILPAIQMAVGAALREMMQTFNQVLEHSLSAKSWRWRFESWRTGKPFAEVVLLRTLVYRVEQVLLIDRHTGLLLLSVTAPHVAPHDTSLISAMLTAIQDFIHESFDIEKSAGLRELQVGDFSLWIEQGPYAAIAAAVRGNAPVELRETVRDAVEKVHREFAAELRHYTGDSTPFESCRAILEGCLQTRMQNAGKSSNWKAVLFLAALVGAGGVWAALRIRQAREWNRALAALQNVPGMVVTQGRRAAGTYFVEGLLDPLAESPQRVLAAHSVDPRILSMRFQPFLSLEPELVLKRARSVLQPPTSASLALDRGVLTLHGAAPHAWILRSRNASPQMSMAGIREIRTGGIQDTDLEALRRSIEEKIIVFPEDSSVFDRNQARIASLAAAESLQWIRGAVEIERVPIVQVIGFTDPSGTSQRNRNLSQERAEHVAAFLVAASVPRERLQVLGNEAPASIGEPASLQRKVVLRPSFGEERIGAR